MAKRTSYAHRCVQCDIIYYTPHKKGMYCSHACKGLAQRKRVKLVCAGCGKQFERIPSRTYDGELPYCTRECYMRVHMQSQGKQEAIAATIAALDFFPRMQYTDENSDDREYNNGLSE